MPRATARRKASMTYEVEVLSCVINKKATKVMLDDVAKDIAKHLERPCGTLANYHGRFTNAIIEPLQKNYRLFPPNEAIVERKVQNIVDSLMRRMLKGSSIRVHTSMVNLIIDYLKGRNPTDAPSTPQYIVVGYPTAKTGNRTLPCPKQDVDVDDDEKNPG